MVSRTCHYTNIVALVRSSSLSNGIATFSSLSHGQEEGIHDPGAQEEAANVAEEEGRRGAEEGAGAEGRAEDQDHR